MVLSESVLLGLGGPRSPFDLICLPPTHLQRRKWRQEKNECRTKIKGSLGIRTEVLYYHPGSPLLDNLWLSMWAREGQLNSTWVTHFVFPSLKVISAVKGDLHRPKKVWILSQINWLKSTKGCYHHPVMSKLTKVDKYPNVCCWLYKPFKKID